VTVSRILYSAERLLVWYYCSKCLCTNWGYKWWLEGQFLWRIRTGVPSVLSVPFENSVISVPN